MLYKSRMVDVALEVAALGDPLSNKYMPLQRTRQYLERKEQQHAAALKAYAIDR